STRGCRAVSSRSARSSSARSRSGGGCPWRSPGAARWASPPWARSRCGGGSGATEGPSLLPRVPLGAERLGDLGENHGVVDRRGRAVLLAVGDLLHRPAQNLARPRLGQALDDERGLERVDRADLLAHLLDQLPDDLGLAARDAGLGDDEAD